MQVTHVIFAYGAVYLASGVSTDPDGSIRAKETAVAVSTDGCLVASPRSFGSGGWPAGHAVVIPIGVSK